MNRGQLISYLKSIIYPNSENKIDAGKHQDLEEKILQNVLVKDDDIVSGEENSSGSTVFSSDYVKTTYATKTELSDKVSSLYHYVGSVSSFSNLPVTPKNCDVYNVLDTGINYAYTGATVDESHTYDSANWDSLGGIQGLATALQNGLMSKEDFAKLRDLDSSKYMQTADYVFDEANPGRPLLNVHFSDYSDRANSAIYDQHGNGIPETYATKSELAEVSGTVLSASQLQIINTVPLICSDELTDITSSSAVPKRRYVFQTAQSFTNIVGELDIAPVGGIFTVIVKKNGNSVFSTNMTFDSGENTTRTASIPCVLSANPLNFAVGDYVEVFVTNVGSSTAGKGLIIYLM